MPGWVTAEDAERIQAYLTYEKMYWNVDETFKLVLRGTEDKPIYLPSPRSIIEATNRFLAKGWNYLVDPNVGDLATQALVKQRFDALFRREEMYAKFGTQRRYGLIRGDACWHIIADPSKSVGSRVSIFELDPASYFPIPDPNDLERVIGCYLVDQIDAGKVRYILRRHEYRKIEGRIWTQLRFYEIGAWDDRFGSSQDIRLAQPPGDLNEQQRALMQGFFLPPEITALPVYHIKNMRTPGSPFGSSELRGFERVFTALNQAISDEELALALDGLGVYVTTSGPPVKSDGKEDVWRIKPGAVLEIDDNATWNRVSGISSLPGIEHMTFLMDRLNEASGTPAIAQGRVDVSIAESGISLYLQLSPLLAKNSDKEAEMLPVYDHMLFDLLNGWFVAYGELDTGIIADVVSVVQDPMPINRDQRVTELLALVAAKVISADYARQKLKALGYDDIPDEIGADIAEETSALAEAAATPVDPFTERMVSELLSDPSAAGNSVASTNGAQ